MTESSYSIDRYTIRTGSDDSFDTPHFPDIPNEEYPIAHCEEAHSERNKTRLSLGSYSTCRWMVMFFGFIVGVLALVMVFYILSQFTFVYAAVDTIIDLSVEYPVASVLIGFVVVVAFVIVGIPVMPLEVASGFVHGWITPVSLVPAKTLGSLIAYFVSQTFCRPRFSNILEKYPQLQIIERVIADSPLKYSLLIRFSIFPLIVKNYALALFNVPVGIFLLATVVTTTPYTIVHTAWGVMAASLWDAFRGKNEKQKTIEDLLFGAGLTMTMIVPILLVRAYWNKIREEHEGEIDMHVAS